MYAVPLQKTLQMNQKLWNMRELFIHHKGENRLGTLEYDNLMDLIRHQLPLEREKD